VKIGTTTRHYNLISEAEIKLVKCKASIGLSGWG